MENTGKMNRRRFVAGAVAAAAAGPLGLCSCQSTGPREAPGPVDVGPLSDYEFDGIRDRFAESHGFMLVTYGGRLTAVSSVCTHKRCFVTPKDGGFVCPCHDSEFTREGQPFGDGPATEPLVHYKLSVNSADHVIVDTGSPLIAPLWGTPEASLFTRKGRG